MTVTYTTIDGSGQAHSRSTFAKTEVCDAPDWVARIGSAGGEHSIATCPQCWLQALMAARRKADGTEARWLSEDERYRAAEGSFVVDTATLSRDELEYLNSKQATRIRRIGERAPVRRLPSVLKELRALANVASKQCQLPGLSQEQARLTMLRYFTLQRSASIAWERLKSACEDRSIAYRLRRYIPPSNPYSSTWT